MRAAYLTGHGGMDVVVVGERPPPVRQRGQVRVRLHAATVNRVDLYMRDSGAGITHTLPLTLGVDGAGVIDETDDDEPLRRRGERVLLYSNLYCGRCEFCQRGDVVLCTSLKILGEHVDGCFAQQVCVPAANALPIPDELDFVSAAALGVNHLTAWRMLFTQARVKPWETVLIFGIGGGVSLAALQLAKAIGATAIVTSRDPGKLERAIALGADHAIHSGAEDVAKRALVLTGGRGVDVVIENVGAAVWGSALKSLVRGGRIVTCGATSGDQPGADLRRLFIRQLHVYGSTMGNPDELRQLIGFVQRHAIKPVIDSRYPLAEVPAALARLEAGAQFGKLAIEI
jgi:NADPH:quinone reductase-like Zn-dependent oxidoreductase